VECPPFADYVPDPNSVFMTLDLRQSEARDDGSDSGADIQTETLPGPPGLCDEEDESDGIQSKA
jgi:hypothetical protein